MSTTRQDVAEIAAACTAQQIGAGQIDEAMVPLRPDDLGARTTSAADGTGEPCSR